MYIDKLNIILTPSTPEYIKTVIRTAHRRHVIIYIYIIQSMSFIVLLFVCVCIVYSQLDFSLSDK